MSQEILSKFEYNQGSFIAGSDEVGRGPLAGPVVAATVMLTINQSRGGDDCKKIVSDYFQQLRNLGITDSKKLTTTKRLRLLKELSINIEELSPSVNYLLRADNYFSTSFNICEISAARIDEINILNASLEAMNNSFTSLFDKNSSGLWLVDGNKSPRKDFFGGVEIYPLVKGDSRDVLIGLASVIAKEYRDRLMEKLSNIYSGYGFEIHAGYPTPLHKDLIQAKGICEIHRKSFKGVKEWVVQN